MDGEAKYDLDRWNPEYFDRLRRFLALASDLGIVVELTLFSNTYTNQIWALNPLRDQNNLQGIGKVDYPEYNSLRDRALVERQKAYARKIVQETSAFDNVYYEICNEPGGGLPSHVTPAEVDAWQEEMGRVLRDELRRLNRLHLVVGQNAFSFTPKFCQAFDASFSGSMLDAVNVHPLPALTLHGRTYQLGNFMSKELRLAELRDFFLATYRERKPGSDYITYLADGRELSHPTAGQPVSGPIVFGLPEGIYRVCFYSPMAGVYSPGIRVRGGDRITLEIPSFQQDLVLRVKRAD